MAISPGFGAGGMPRSVLVVVLAVSVLCSGVAGVREPLDSAGSEDVRGAAEVWGSRGEIGRSREAGLRTVDAGVYVEGDAGAENVDSNAELSVHGFRVRRARSVDDSRNALERPAAPVRRIEAGGDSVDATGDAFGRQNAGVIETIHLIRGRFLLGGASPPPDNVKGGNQSTGDARGVEGPSQSKDQRTSPDAEKKTPVPPSPNEQPPPKDDSATKDQAGKAAPPPPASPPPVKVEPSSSHEGKCHGPVIGSLVASGEDGSHDYSLSLRNDGKKSELDVKIVTPKVLLANPETLVLKKGETKTVIITVTDREAVKLGANITVTWDGGGCVVDEIPITVQDAGAHSLYLSLITLPGSGVLLLGGALLFVAILGIAGVWACCCWRSRSQRHAEGNGKYQELEMSLPTVDISKKEKEEIAPSAEGWDEVWEDDEWEDTEAVRSSSTSLTLSAKGLNSRRANKEGWDSGWDE